MNRHLRAAFRLALCLPPAAAGWGCSQDSVPPIDKQAALAKVEGKSPPPAKGSEKVKAARAAENEAASKHPKLK